MWGMKRLRIVEIGITPAGTIHRFLRFPASLFVGLETVDRG